MSATAMWTDWSCQVRLTIDRPDFLADARKHLVLLMDDVAKSANRFRPDSDISRINGSAGRMVPVSGRTIGLLETALDAAAVTGGAVDPTVGAHVRRAGYDADIDIVRAVTRPAKDDTLPQADWTSVQINHSLSLAGIPRGLQLDLGASAKAWTADVAAHAIAGMLGTAVLVEIGGDVSVAGRRECPWQIQVSEQTGEPGQRVAVSRGGVATSSTAARRWRTTAGEAHHIIDPRTGRPSSGPWRTATVWAPTAVEANTSSTAALILGDEAVAYLEDTHVAARLVDNSGRVRVTCEWPAEAEAA
ncbi:FAD:protein FMN transferase [Aeromicrobium sp.]|uniref:FAD:protein FMN transferase n=1 Tax=Aeromicrobium sp. TaxID=1871063 RepID=UPI00199A3406|nr:FAD:protein FMN transferase [Aeromicrobium sp.]MBC7633564.1 FAD:protein FMN transferase [Aeromicrobium sp.]